MYVPPSHLPHPLWEESLRIERGNDIKSKKSMCRRSQKHKRVHKVVAGRVVSMCWISIVWVCART